MSDIQEIVFYVHGVSSALEGSKHLDQYKALHEGIGSFVADPNWPEEFGGAEWGWQFDDQDSKGHKLLTAAQANLSKEVSDIIEDQWDFTLNPTRSLVNGLRKLTLFGFSDIFYYVSEDGKRSVRHSICKQLLRYIQPDSDKRYSITLVGHSAGAAIAFDLLYYLFSQRTGRKFLGSTEEDATLRGLDALKQLRHQGKLRLRRLITLGAPISMVAYRSNALVEIFARGEKLRPQDYGFESTLDGQAPLGGPRWINIWDKDDPISYPIAPIMDSPLAEDVYVNVSSFISSAHTAYWRTEAVHEEIAARW